MENLNNFIDEIKKAHPEYNNQPSLNTRLEQMKRINRSNKFKAYIKAGRVIIESNIVEFGNIEKEITKNEKLY